MRHKKYSDIAITVTVASYKNLLNIFVKIPLIIIFPSEHHSGSENNFVMELSKSASLIATFNQITNTHYKFWLKYI